MSQRFFVYPLLFVVLMQLVPLLRRDARWFLAQICQQLLILLAALGAIYFTDDAIWVVIAWVLFALFVLAPRFLATRALARELRGNWRAASRFWRWAGRFAWGHLGRLQRRHAAALHFVAQGDLARAEAQLDALAAQPMPAAMHGEVLSWKLSLLFTRREWARVREFYDSVQDWGTLGLAIQARVMAARAFAETGDFERALRSLQFVALSPRTLGARRSQFLVTRVCITALAGDVDGMEALLKQREFAVRLPAARRFAEYWRGRCALERGDRATAVQYLTRAFALTPARLLLWRDAVAQQLQRAETGALPSSCAAQTEKYAHGQEVLRMADKQSAQWRALMYVGWPQPVTAGLLAVCVTVFVVEVWVLPFACQEKLLLWLGNGAETITHGEWWRVFTALFLHANWLHLGMNSLAIWIFGSAVEKVMGRWRLLLVFFLAGAAGNVLSASLARYDVAVGASAGIFGVVGAFGVAAYRLDAPMYLALRRRLLMLLALMVAADFTIGGLEPQVDNLAHVGGFFAGILLALALSAQRWPRRAQRRGQPVGLTL